MTALWVNDILDFTFYVTISNSIANWTTFVNKFSALMLSSESDEMTAMWQNYS